MVFHQSCGKQKYIPALQTLFLQLGYQTETAIERNASLPRRA